MSLASYDAALRHKSGNTYFTRFRNLQAAVNSWFEYGGAVVLPQARFVKDITIGEGESVPPNEQFTKTWRIGEILNQARF